ncbi:reverse transcriptase domain-containing protein [Tanacetum coccineum]
MRTRSQTRNRNRQQSQPAVVQPFHLEEPFVNPPLVPMADNRTMAQLLQAPTEGYEDAIVIPEINANFELKHGLINLVQNKQFFGHDKEDPHAHIRYFNKITSTMRFPDVPSTSIKLMLFLFSLEGSARIWLEKEPPRSILTWDDLVSKFINQFFPPSKMTNLRNEITRFQQRFDESFYEAWDRFNDLLRACPHHGFSELHQLDTFYNALNANDQDSLNSAAGGNFLDKMPRECLRIIESKSKVRNSRNKAVVAKVSSNSSTPEISPDVAALTTEVSELKNLIKTMLIDKQKAQAPATVKAVEQSCVTYGGAHSYKNCPATNGNGLSDNIQSTLPSQTVTNPREHVNAITTRSENTVQVPPSEDHDSIFIEIPKPKGKKTVQEPISPDPDSYQPKLPYPERMKVREKDKPSAQQSSVHEENFQVYSNPVFEFDDNFTSSNENPLFNEMVKDVENKNSNVSNSDEPIDAFLAMEVSSNFEECYFDSKEDVIFIENLLSDDTTHNLAPEVISDHEPKQNESIYNTSITFSPRSDARHHEFDGNRMTLLCEISTSRSQENVHANPSSIIESFPVSLIPVEDSEPVQEEIDIFLLPDDLIPPGVENDDSEDEDNELPNLDHQDNPSSPRPPPDVCLNFKPDTAIKNDEDFNQGEIVLSLNVEDVNSFTFVIWTFLSFITYPEDSPVIISLMSEDLVFDPGIFIFHFI